MHTTFMDLTLKHLSTLLNACVNLGSEMSLFKVYFKMFDINYFQTMTTKTSNVLKCTKINTNTFEMYLVQVQYFSTFRKIST